MQWYYRLTHLQQLTRTKELHPSGCPWSCPQSSCLSHLQSKVSIRLLSGSHILLQANWKRVHMWKFQYDCTIMLLTVTNNKKKEYLLLLRTYTKTLVGNYIRSTESLLLLYLLFYPIQFYFLVFYETQRTWTVCSWSVITHNKLSLQGEINISSLSKPLKIADFVVKFTYEENNFNEPLITLYLCIAMIIQKLWWKKPK